MDTGTILFLVLVALFIVVFVSIRILKRKESIRAVSDRYHDILLINKRFVFHSLQQVYSINKNLSSKAKFDRFNFDNCLESDIEINREQYKTRIDWVYENANRYEKYTKVLLGIHDYLTVDDAKHLNIPYQKCRELERDLCEEAMLSPVVDFRYVINIGYISPKGRNSYRDSKEYPLSMVVYHYNHVMDALEFRESKEYQRRKMSDSLRYDILKRDGFRCVICGRTSADGVKLHVDHILPVSKGGKTIPSNLRTLCDQCNMGKRDKYDTDGFN